MDSKTKIDIINLGKVSEENVITWSVNRGHLAVKIDSLVHRNDSSLVYGSLGPTFLISEISINADSSIGNSLTKMGDKLTGTRYKADAVFNLIDEINKNLEDNGYLLAETNVRKPVISDSLAQVALSIDVEIGPRAVSAGIWTNHLKTSPVSYLKRSLGVDKGSLITPELLLEVQRSQEESGFFSSVSTPDLMKSDSSTFWIVPRGREIQANRFDVMVGYVPNQVEGSGTVVGNVDLTLRNIFYEGSSTEILFQRLQPFVSKLNLSYGADWIAGSNLLANTDLFFIQQDSTYLFRRIGLDVGYRFQRRNQISIGFRSQNSVDGRGFNNQTTRRVADSRSTFVTVTYSFSNLDSRVNPTKGVSVEVSFDEGQKTIFDSDLIGNSGDIRWRQRFINVQSSLFVPLGYRNGLRVRNMGYFAISPGYFEDDMRRFGGALSLRGFNEDQFFASKVWWGDLEYRYMLDATSFAFMFLAQAAYQRDAYYQSDSIKNLIDYPRSAGLGISFVTNIGRLMVTYASEFGQPFSNGKIHVGLVGRL